MTPSTVHHDSKTTSTTASPCRRWSIIVSTVVLAFALCSEQSILYNASIFSFTTTTISSSSRKNDIIPTSNKKSSASNSHSVEEQQQTSCSCDDRNIDHPFSSSSFASTIGFKGNVSDCCCSFEDMEQANYQTVYPILKRIVATPFFAYFKINLCSTCELWDDAPLCMLRDCGVCECDQPPEWAVQEDQVITTIDPHIQNIQSSWANESILPFLDFDEPGQGSNLPDANSYVDEDNAVVVDLRLNPEKYTGYAGTSAERVWSAIHSDNCFQFEEDGDNSLAAEQRVYNRIISGLHSSISLHIAHSYCLEMDPDQIAECKRWGPNPTLANTRVLHHKDRLENLYVVFAVLLRAVQKAGPAVTAAVPVADAYFQGSIIEWTVVLLPKLVELAETCPLAFDESSLFDVNRDDDPIKRRELERRFRHLLQIMSCVGCDRCKLWGSLQAMGISTALKVLLDDNPSISLSRQEAVALIHTLERFSSALVFARDLATTTE